AVGQAGLVVALDADDDRVADLAQAGRLGRPHLVGAGDRGDVQDAPAGLLGRAAGADELEVLAGLGERGQVIGGAARLVGDFAGPDVDAVKAEAHGGGPREASDGTEDDFTVWGAGRTGADGPVSPRPESSRGALSLALPSKTRV